LSVDYKSIFIIFNLFDFFLFLYIYSKGKKKSKPKEKLEGRREKFMKEGEKIR